MDFKIKLITKKWIEIKLENEFCKQNKKKLLVNIHTIVELGNFYHGFFMEPSLSLVSIISKYGNLTSVLLIKMFYCFFSNR